MNRSLINKALKTTLFTSLTLSPLVLKAHECDVPFSNIKKEFTRLENQSSISLREMSDLGDAFNDFKKSIKDFDCAESTFAKTKDMREEIKSIRIQTIQKKLMNNVEEEGGNSLRDEYNFLTGKDKNVRYENANLFSENFKESIIQNSFSDKDIKKVDDSIEDEIKKLKEEELKKIKEEELKKQEIKKQQDTKKQVAAKETFEVKTFETNDPSCSGVTIENEAVNFKNVRDQDTVGWCYAYALSDLLSYRLNDRISAVSLYASAPDMEDDIRSDGGAGAAIVNALREHVKKYPGFCLEKDLPSSDFKFCLDFTYQDAVLRFLDAARKNNAFASMQMDQCFAGNVNQLFPGLSSEKIKQFGDESGSYRMLEKITAEQCKNKAYTDFKPKSHFINSPYVPKSDIIKKINQNLDAKTLSGIGYEYNKMDLKHDVKVFSHASVVVGRRKNNNTGKCEYLLRNSWGKTCTQKEDKDLTCHTNCDSFGCKPSGNFWVSEERLTDAIFDVTTITN